MLENQEDALVRMEHIQRAPGDSEVHIGEVVLYVELQQARCLGGGVELAINDSQF